MEIEHKYQLKARTLWIISSCLLILFASIAYCMSQGIIVQFDMYVLEKAIQLRQSILTNIVTIITYLGSGMFEVAVWLVLTILLLIQKRKAVALLFTVNVAGVWLLNDLLKEFFARSRPDYVFRLVEANSYSFPSGHAMGSAAFYGMLAYILVTQYKMMKSYSHILIAGAVVLVLLIGCSRMYLGVHYFSDVLAGFTMGTAWLVYCILGARAILAFRTEKQEQDISM